MVLKVFISFACLMMHIIAVKVGNFSLGDVRNGHHVHSVQSRNKDFVDFFKESSSIFATACLVLVLSSEIALGSSWYTMYFKYPYKM